MKNTAPAQITARASLHWDWSFHLPVFADDSLFARITVVGIRPLTRNGEVELRLRFDVQNQDGALVQSGENRLRAYL